jgi:uncharacterized membrane protein YdbT with pleckstrin-like domain
MKNTIAKYHPDFTAYIGNYIVGFLLMITPVLYPAFWDSPIGNLLQIGLPILVGIGFFLVAGAEFMRRTTYYCIGEEGLSKEFSFIARSSSFVSYMDIEQLNVTQSVFQRIFNVGDIDVDTAAEHGVDVEFANIRNPQGVESFIRTKIDSSATPRGQDSRKVLLDNP